MSSKEIGSLTGAATLDGSETVHAVQSGNSRKTTTQDIADLGTSQDNMADGTTNKNYTATEKTKLAGITVGADMKNSDNLSGLSSADTALTNLGGGASGVAVFKAADTAALTTALAKVLGRYDTIADMTAVAKADLIDGGAAFVSSYSAVGDGGGGWFNWRSDSTATADGGIVFASDEGGTGRWVRNTAPHAPNCILLRWYGLKLTAAADSASPDTDDVAHNDTVLAAIAATYFGSGISIQFPKPVDEDGAWVDGTYDFAQFVRPMPSFATAIGSRNFIMEAEGGIGSGPYFAPRVRWVGTATDAEQDLTVPTSGGAETCTTEKTYTSGWLRIDGGWDVRFKNLDFVYASDIANDGADATDWMFIIDGYPKASSTSTIQWAFENCGFSLSDTSVAPPTDGAIIWALNALEGSIVNPRCDILAPNNLIVLGQFYPATYAAHFTDSSYRPAAGGSARNIRFSGGHIYGNIAYRLAGNVTFDNVAFTSQPSPSQLIEQVDSVNGDTALGYGWTFNGGTFGGVLTDKYGTDSLFADLSNMKGLTFRAPSLQGRQLFVRAGGNCRDFIIEAPFSDNRTLTATDSVTANGSDTAEHFPLIVESGVATDTVMEVKGSSYWDAASDPIAHGHLQDNRTGNPDYQSIGTDSNATLTVGTTGSSVRHIGTLTADRTLTLATTNAYAGASFRVTRTGTGAFNLSVGGLKDLATNTWCVVRFAGGFWYLEAYGAL